MTDPQPLGLSPIRHLQRILDGRTATGLPVRILGTPYRAHPRLDGRPGYELVPDRAARFADRLTELRGRAAARRAAHPGPWVDPEHDARLSAENAPFRDLQAESFNRP